MQLVSSLEDPVRASYEAGPTAYGLARALELAGVECVVAAPGKIPRGATERVKTDRRDAEHLVRLLFAGKLHPVRVPGPAEEALRDLVRAREDIRGDLMRARHRLSKLLLRHEVRFAGRAWTERHRAWLATVQLGEDAAQATLIDYLGAVEALLHRKQELERQIAAAVPAAPWAEEVDRLRCVDTLTAVGLCAEIGDFARFARAGQLMSYLGPLRALKRREPPARLDHAPCPAAAGSGRMAFTATSPASASSSSAASKASPRKRWRSPSRRSGDCTASGRACAGAASARR
ncbi:MAG: IS110 family transposase [Thermoleophilaceae bacterium]